MRPVPWTCLGSVPLTLRTHKAVHAEGQELVGSEAVGFREREGATTHEKAKAQGG